MTTTSDDSTGMPPSGHVASQLRHWRKQRGLTAEELAARCAELGAPHITAQVVWNLEYSRRQLSLDVFMMLAMALDVPPLSLLIPAQDPTATVEITPVARVDAARFATWVTGTQPLPITDTTAFAEAASGLTAGVSPDSTSTTVDGRAAWWAKRIDAQADQVAAQVAESLRDFAVKFTDQLAEYSEAAADPTQTQAALQRFRERLGLDEHPDSAHGTNGAETT